MKRVAAHSAIQWVAHRGYPKRYPENSLEGFEAALRSGAQFIECDIQLSFDGVPMVIHDVELNRLTGYTQRVFDLQTAELQAIPLMHESLSSAVSNQTCIPTLSDLFQLLKKYPHITVFIEIKVESIHHFGIDTYLDCLLSVIDDCPSQYVLISFSSKVLSRIVDHGTSAIGWILPEWSISRFNTAQALQPEWLFCNVRRFPSDPALVWPGPWKWCLYVINDSHSAHLLQDQGIRYLETDCITEMMHGPD